MNNQKGLTLVELLVSIVIFSFVAVFATSLLITAMKTQKTVSSDIILRDEADLIMSSIIKELYTSKDSEFKFHEDSTNNNYYISKIDDPSIITGFKDNEVLLKGKSLNFDSRINVIWDDCEIELTENSNLDRTYQIVLSIETTNKVVKKTFKSEVRSINDVIKEDEEG